MNIPISSKRLLFIYCTFCAANLALRIFYTPMLNGDNAVESFNFFTPYIVGFVNDSVIFLYLFILQITIVGWFLAFRKTPFFVFSLLAVISLLLVLFQLIVDYVFLFEFSSRGNRMLFHYLKFPREVFLYLEEQFRFSLILVAVVPLLVVVYFMIKKKMRFEMTYLQQWLCQIPLAQLIKVRAVLLIVSLLIITCSSTLVSWGGLQVFHSRLFNEYSNNGLMTLLTDIQVVSTSWKENYQSLEEGKARKIAAKFRSKVAGKVGKIEGIKHVVLIIEESFSGENWFNLQERAKYMPNMSKIAKGGLHFVNAFATGSRTNRGLESILNAYPPLPGIALNQREGYERLPSLARQMNKSGFATQFIFGGSHNFANLPAYWKKIGFKKILTRKDFTNPEFETSWGVADQLLFKRMLTEIDDLSQREQNIFIASITATNHRPYDVPNIKELDNRNDRTLKKAIQYADWSLGEFMKEAAKKAWFNDTLFIIVADHAPEISGHVTVPINSFRIPLVFYAPQYIKPEVNTKIASSMDISLTLMGILGIEHDEQFWGKDLRHSELDWAIAEHDYAIALLKPYTEVEQLKKTASQVVTIIPYRKPAESWLLGQSSEQWQPVVDQDKVETLSAIFQEAFQYFYGEL